MKLDYIYHSGFAIEADGVTVIIDYYKDSSEEVFNKGIVHDYLLESRAYSTTMLAFPSRPLQSRSSFMEKTAARHPLHILQRHPEAPPRLSGRCHLHQ